MSTVPTHAVVWFEIPVTDLAKSTAFYQAITQHEMVQTEMGGQAMSIFPTTDPATGVSGNLVEGKPAGEGAGPTLHLVCKGKLEDTIQRVWDAGGRVVSPEVVIPEGRFAYCLDLDGNSISIFEANS